MHELSIAMHILDIVREYVPEAERDQVHDIRLRIGPYAGIVAESLVFGFTTLVLGSDLRNATLVIETPPIILSCGACGRASPAEYGVFNCPRCGAADIGIASGQELQIVDIELRSL